MDYQLHQHIAYLTFNRPHRANALDLAGWEALRAACERADADPEVRVVVLRGNDRHFCAGMDITVLQEMQERFRGTGGELRERVTAFIAGLQDCVTAIERCRKPVVAAVEGACIGGGVDILTACDVRYCTKDARFSVKEVDLGIVADLGTLQRLPGIVNPGVAAELAFTARTFDGREAEAMGLVAEALGNGAQLRYRVGQTADAIAAKPPRVIAGIKAALLQQRGRPVGEGLTYVAGLSARTMLGE
ncbi:enoyl-CoA hydratase-related protein [Lewinella sp. IMCC34183]|uniref:enoyl-CoA hydratase-related protein n=1 Tax=Lewinella sp. IMCC34183 TaxID=2248762 RepID=UPI000E2606DB|nr:enoyl-CoA hydratase-related protein [Lewinella sp. IMCC34183]